MMKQLISRFKKSQSGFTLVEMLVYLAIFLVVSTASVSFLLSLNGFIGQYKLETILYRSGTGMMEQVLLAVRQADQVDVLDTIEDLPATGKLTVSNSATTTEFLINAGALELDINGVNYGDITSQDVTVDGFTVYYYDFSGKEFVRVRVTLTATLDSGQSKTITFYGGSIIRGAL